MYDLPSDLSVLTFTSHYVYSAFLEVLSGDRLFFDLPYGHVQMYVKLETIGQKAPRHFLFFTLNRYPPTAIPIIHILLPNSKTPRHSLRKYCPDLFVLAPWCVVVSLSVWLFPLGLLSRETFCRYALLCRLSCPPGLSTPSSCLQRLLPCPRWPLSSHILGFDVVSSSLEERVSSVGFGDCRLSWKSVSLQPFSICFTRWSGIITSSGSVFFSWCMNPRPCMQYKFRPSTHSDRQFSVSRGRFLKTPLLLSMLWQTSFLVSGDGVFLAWPFPEWSALGGSLRSLASQRVTVSTLYVLSAGDLTFNLYVHLDVAKAEGPGLSALTSSRPSLASLLDSAVGQITPHTLTICVCGYTLSHISVLVGRVFFYMILGKIFSELSSLYCEN